MNTRLRAALIFAGTVFLSALLLWGMDGLRNARVSSGLSGKLRQEFREVLDGKSFKEVELPPVGEEGVTGAYLVETERGSAAACRVRVKGYGGIIELLAGVEGDRITGITVVSHNESEDIGSKITEPAFLRQFEGASAPVSGGGTLKDGEYEARADDYDTNGFLDSVTMTVKDGKITAARWESVNKEGVSKRKLAKEGRYVMTEDGLLWNEQADKVEQLLLELQSPYKLELRDDGRTDAVSGVSISVKPYSELAAEAYAKAGGGKGGTVDVISGATYSSQAVIRAANYALELAAELLGGTSQSPSDTSGDSSDSGSRSQSSTTHTEATTSLGGDNGEPTSADIVSSTQESSTSSN